MQAPRQTGIGMEIVEIKSRADGEFGDGPGIFAPDFPLAAPIVACERREKNEPNALKKSPFLVSGKLTVVHIRAFSTRPNSVSNLV